MRTKVKTATRNKLPKKLPANFFDQFTAPERFFKLPEGWVRDTLLGLDWGPSSDKTMNLKDAEAYCKNLGGRLPEVRELHSLVDYTKRKPAVVEALKDMKFDDWYWTSTECAWNSSCAWCVFFYYGDMSNDDKVGNNYVRPVRASQ